MKLEFSSVRHGGNLNEERLILKAEADIDVGNYVVLQTGMTDEGKPTTRVYEAFWFPWQSVKTGDLVVIYTKGGTQNKKEIAGGRHAHFFYWNLSAPVWNKSDRACVVLYAPAWAAKAASELAK